MNEKLTSDLQNQQLALAHTRTIQMFFLEKIWIAAWKVANGWLLMKTSHQWTYVFGMWDDVVESGRKKKPHNEAKCTQVGSEPFAGKQKWMNKQCEQGSQQVIYLILTSWLLFFRFSKCGKEQFDQQFKACTSVQCWSNSWCHQVRIPVEDWLMRPLL